MWLLVSQAARTVEGGAVDGGRFYGNPSSCRARSESWIIV